MLAAMLESRDAKKTTRFVTNKLRRDELSSFRRAAGLIFLVLLQLCGSTYAVAQTGKLSTEKQSAIDKEVSAFMAAGKVPGLSVAVVEDGTFVWSEGFGMADLENSVHATAQTLYRIGSISKSITATAAMQLWEQGKLKLDAPVQMYCPLFPQKNWPITTRELLGHVGGIRYYHVPEIPYSKSESDPEVGNTRHFDNGIDAGLTFFAADPLVAKPGTHFTYSTQGYTLVGCAIEGASGEKYATFVHEHVLLPAGMLETQPDDRFAIIPLRTHFYSKDASGAVINAEFLDASYKLPGGGWLSSAPDLARFEVAILGDRLVTPTTRDLMWTPQIPSDGLGRMVYGLGWQAGTTGDVAHVGHGGSQQGASAMMLIAPERKAGVVVLTNSDAAGASTLAPRLLRIVLGLSSEHHEVAAVDPALLDRYIGDYAISGFTLKIVREGNSLFVLTNGRRIEMLPESSRDFFFKTAEAQITFSADGEGPAKEFVLQEGGFDLIAARVP